MIFTLDFGLKSYRYNRVFEVLIKFRPFKLLATRKTIDTAIMRSGAVFAQDPAKCPWEFVL